MYEEIIYQDGQSPRASRRELKEKAAARKLGRGIGSFSAPKKIVPFDPDAWDGDSDGLVQEGTTWERPATPSTRITGFSPGPSLSSGDLEKDYRGQHGAPDKDSGAPLHNMDGIYPEDVYSNEALRYYGTGDDLLDQQALSLIKRFRNKPNAVVTVYRSVPISRAKRIANLEKEAAYVMKYGKPPRTANTRLSTSDFYQKVLDELKELRSMPDEQRMKINPGDWVSPVRQYVVDHGDAHLGGRGKYQIISKKVKAKEIYTAGDSWLEWGYSPQKETGLSSGANENNINWDSLYESDELPDLREELEDYLSLDSKESLEGWVGGVSFANISWPSKYLKEVAGDEGIDHYEVLQSRLAEAGFPEIVTIARRGTSNPKGNIRNGSAFDDWTGGSMDGPSYGQDKKLFVSEVPRKNIIGVGSLEEGEFFYINDGVATREIDETSNNQGLSSGKPPSFPRKPTYGAFIGKANDIFEGVSSWEEFKERYDEQEVVFFDYETTGLVFDEFRKPSSNGSPVQFGAVKVKNGKEVGRINIFMNPKEGLGEWSRNNLKDIDGNPLTDEWLETQDSIEDAHRQLIEFAGPDALFGVQNAAFDKDVLDDVLAAMGDDWKPAGYIDTRELASLVLPKWSEDNQDGPFIEDREGNKKPSSSLAAITEYLGVELGDGHHNADVDAFATSEVMKKMIDGAIENNWSRDALDKDKRDSLLQATIDKFNKETEKFEQDKISYLENLENKTPDTSVGLSSGKEYSYGDVNELGEEVRANRPNWLDGLTPKQIANLVVVSSSDEVFDRAMDRILQPKEASDARSDATRRREIEKPIQHVATYSSRPEDIERLKEEVEAALTESPIFHAVVQKFGIPPITAFTELSIAPNEFARDQYSGLYQAGISVITMNAAYLTGDKSGDYDRDARGLFESSLEDVAPKFSQSSTKRTLMHEYGHYIDDLFIERGLGQRSHASRKLQEQIGDKAFTEAQRLISTYDNEAGEILSKKFEAEDFREDYYQEFESGEISKELLESMNELEYPFSISQYSLESPRELFAEGVSFYMNPNPEFSGYGINSRLRSDIESILGIASMDIPERNNTTPRRRISGLSSGSTFKSDNSATDLNDAYWKGVDRQKEILTSEEKNQLDNYVREGHYNVNELLRGKLDLDNLSYSETKNRIPILDSVFQKTSLASATDGVVYRGIRDGKAKEASESWFTQLKPGDVIEDRGFISTTQQEEVSHRFSSDRSAVSVQFKINIPKGTRVLAGLELESELILNRGTKMRIVSVVTRERTTRDGARTDENPWIVKVEAEVIQ